MRTLTALAIGDVKDGLRQMLYNYPIVLLNIEEYGENIEDEILKQLNFEKNLVEQYLTMISKYTPKAYKFIKSKYFEQRSDADLSYYLDIPENRISMLDEFLIQKFYEMVSKNGKKGILDKVERNIINEQSNSRR